ncbi:MAG: Zn-dependent hydrolase of the beta-lactamase fold-like protein [Parcubacteria group bacterium GW2011_GWC2_39_14]|nr:MAG: Zn-dependent hydrolase of the beta-lactamase fold-like protein [Parcubacteria group bacterium GW2011_GWC2_39_14]KKR54128.1 MAG: Zn-dependent hydrolase of the beta-lactamase fold-like protein [Parcubacteria group bacterium GW2011_GWA2_40_23]
MNITWLGQSCFEIEDKISGIPVVLVTDPYDKDIGLRLPKTRADIVTVSHDHHDHNYVEGIIGVDEKTPFIIDRPGEYEFRGMFVTGIGSYHDKEEGAKLGKSTMYKIESEDLCILHCGDLGTTLSEAQIEKIGEVDILLIPVGGKYTLDAKDAAEVVRQIEPRVVIPMHYKIPGLNIDISGVEAFCKEMGSEGERMNKFKFQKKDLPIEETKFIILEKE